MFQIDDQGKITALRVFSPAVQIENQIENLPEPLQQQLFKQQEFPNLDGFDQASAPNLQPYNRLVNENGRESSLKKAAVNSEASVETTAPCETLVIDQASGDESRFLPDLIPKPSAKSCHATDKGLNPPAPVPKEGKLSYTTMFTFD